MYRHLIALLCGCWLAWDALSAVAQVSRPSETAPPALDTEISTLDDPADVLSALPTGRGGDSPGAKVQFSGAFQVQQGGRDGKLSVQATLQPGWHIYATTQPQGGPRPTVLSVSSSAEFQLLGEFAADRDPTVSFDPVFPGVPMEEFFSKVMWTAPIRLAEGADPKLLSISMTVSGQLCDAGGSCEPLNREPVPARFAGYYQAPQVRNAYREAAGHATITGHIEPAVVAPGTTLQLVLTASLEPTWHIYRLAARDPNKISKPTLIVLRKTGGWVYGTPTASVEAAAEQSGLPEEPVLYYHEGTVSWTVPIQVPREAKPGQYLIAGGIAYQTCTPNSCDAPSGVDFEVAVTVGKDPLVRPAPLSFTKSKYATIAQEADTVSRTRQAEPREGSADSASWSEKPVLTVLALAFLAGLILNVMPCVLPVIGLKVMSFVQQAGGSRREILALNLWFSLGLMAVFWILAAAAAFANHTWGTHFGDMRFLMTMIGIVFAFGLSFLGVWEIPIPGFVGSGTVQATAQREGAIGALSKGVLSTILATPCAGPLLVPAVSWAAMQPAWLTFLTFTSIGLGMASPYLLVGIAPELIRFLPKPGAWMDTFKQAMGFLLMATVVFLFLSVPAEYTVPALTLLLGIAIACWLVGRIPVTATRGNQVQGWATGLLVIAAAAVIGFVFLVPQTKIDWQPFSRLTLDQYLEEGNTVLVDFTANW